MRWRLPHLALSKPLGNGNESKDSRNHNREENHADSTKFQPHVMGAVGYRTKVLTVLRVCPAATVDRIGIIRRQLQGLIKVQDRPGHSRPRTRTSSPCRRKHWQSLDPDAAPDRSPEWNGRNRASA